MSGGPFREMFVELSADVFAIAKGLGEAAVRQAAKDLAVEATPVRPRMSGREFVSTVVRRWYGWDKDGESVLLAPLHDAITVSFCDGCLHRQQIEIPAEVLYLESDIKLRVHALIDHIEPRRHRRRCYCAPRPEAS